MQRRPLTPLLFLVTGGLFLVAAIRDLFFPLLFSHGNGRPLLSASIGVVFLILGLGQRSRDRRGPGPHQHVDRPIV